MRVDGRILPVCATTAVSKGGEEGDMSMEGTVACDKSRPVATEGRVNVSADAANLSSASEHLVQVGREFVSA
jgi:hypothetical protein